MRERLRDTSGLKKYHGDRVPERGRRMVATPGDRALPDRPYDKATRARVHALLAREAARLAPSLAEPLLRRLIVLPS
jgi:hypothetical protein